jgi:hypothetical protein
VRKTFATLDEAREWQERIRGAIRRGEASARRGPTIRAAGEELIAGMRSGVVRASRRRRVQAERLRRVRTLDAEGDHAGARRSPCDGYPAT